MASLETGAATIGNGATAVGKAIVTGAGSAWNVAGALTIANLGTGTLTVESDASVAATGLLTIGDPAGRRKSARSTFNGGTITAGGFTRAGASVFNWTDGTLLLTGGALNNGGQNLTINGSALDDLPALRLGGGATSTAASIPNLSVGTNRQGAVIVSGGSNFQTTTASIGSQTAATARFTSKVKAACSEPRATSASAARPPRPVDLAE